LLILGLIAILQVTLLPGLIVLRFLNVQGFLLKSILAFALSLTLNYELVFLLTITGCYTRSAMSAVIVVEFLMLGWFLIRDCGFSRRIRLTFLPWRIKNQPPSFLFVHSLLLALAFYSFVLLLFALYNENPGVFRLDDDVLSWNRWAIDWFHNNLPSRTWEYPQLLPTNWSITYILIGSEEVQLFAKAVMALFPVGILLIFYDAYQRFRFLGALAGIVFCTYFFLRVFGGPLLGSGYADIPVAFFAALTFYLLYLYSRDAINLKDALWSVAIVASGAVLTKQAGLFVVFVALPTLIMLIRPGNAENVSLKRRKSLSLFYATAIIILLVAPWYVMKGFDIIKGRDQSNIRYVMHEVHPEKNLLKRALTAAVDLNNELGLPHTVLAGLFLLLILSLRTGIGRASVALIGLPYYLIWSFFFSYETRNLALSVPFFSLAAGEGLCQIVGFVTRNRAKESMPSLPYTLEIPSGASLIVVVSFIAILASLSHRYPSERLIEITHEMTMNVGNRAFNQKLYEFYHTHGFRGKVLSAYLGTAVLPGIREFYYTGRFKLPRDMAMLWKNSYLCEILDHMTSSREIRYLIIRDTLYPAIIDHALQKGVLAPIFSESGISFYEVRCFP
jgi:hypothetical protein